MKMKIYIGSEHKDMYKKPPINLARMFGVELYITDACIKKKVKRTFKEFFTIKPRFKLYKTIILEKIIEDGTFIRKDDCIYMNTVTYKVLLEAIDETDY